MDKFICKYCGKICKNLNSLHNHERLCKANPNRAKSNFSDYNKTSHYNQYTKARALGLPYPVVSEETRKKISIATTRNNLARSKDINEKISKTCLAKSANGEWHKSLAKDMHYNYNGIDLDGKWEVKFAEYLDSHQIKWTRPSIRFKYLFEGSEHYYTPDFYLIDSDTFIEIKGYKTKKDTAKWKQFPNDKILKVYRKKDLIALGINLDK